MTGKRVWMAAILAAVACAGLGPAVAEAQEIVWIRQFGSPESTGSKDCDPSDVLGMQVAVDATAVKRDGLLGLAVGESISTPLLITYGDFGFVNFNPNVKGKNPCKNKSSYVTATRTSDTTWEIIADPNTIGCVTLPGPGDFGGSYRMPFQFTIAQK